MSTRTDLAHGRQGGGWLPDDYEPTEIPAAPLCTACGRPMLARQRGTHGLCADARSLAGKQCSCPPGCTRIHVGDRGTCDPACVVCTAHVGELHEALWPKPKRSPA